MTVAVEQDERGQGMELRHHSPGGIRSPFGRYHHAVEAVGARRLLFVSGQLGIRLDGSVPEQLAEQAEQVFANIDACLEAAGFARQPAGVSARPPLSCSTVDGMSQAGRRRRRSHARLLQRYSPTCSTVTIFARTGFR